jgi:hypothetical protein
MLTRRRPAPRKDTHLPVIVDPSHALGIARLFLRSLPPARRRTPIIEVHPDPANALGWGAVAGLQFEELMLPAPLRNQPGGACAPFRNMVPPRRRGVVSEPPRTAPATELYDRAICVRLA